MDLGLRNRVVVVTGGASGIRSACVALFAAEGARVVDLAASNDLVALFPPGQAISVRTNVVAEADVE